MKKLIFVGILGLFVLGSCNNSTVTHTHNEHDHATEGHNHEAEGSDHSHEGECSGEHNHEAADLPKRTVMKSSFRRQKLKQPVSR